MNFIQNHSEYDKEQIKEVVDTLPYNTFDDKDILWKLIIQNHTCIRNKNGRDIFVEIKAEPPKRHTRGQV